MAFKHGKSTVFKLDSGAAALVDISAFLDDVQVPEKIAADETTTFGAAGGAKTFLQGLKDATISLTGKFDATLDTQMNTLIANLTSGTIASAMWSWDPAGVGTGTPHRAGNAIITAYDTHTPVGGVVTFKIDLQVSGVVAKTTNP
jgi:predicted secreted protein